MHSTPEIKDLDDKLSQARVLRKKAQEAWKASSSKDEGLANLQRYERYVAEELAAREALRLACRKPKT
jgi:hypothetical protein